MFPQMILLLIVALGFSVRSPRCTMELNAFGEKLEMRFMFGDDHGSPFKTTNNNCFMVSAVNQLTHIPLLTDKFLQAAYDEHTRNDISTEHEGCSKPLHECGDCFLIESAKKAILHNDFLDNNVRIRNKGRTLLQNAFHKLVQLFRIRTLTTKDKTPSAAEVKGEQCDARLAFDFLVNGCGLDIKAKLLIQAHYAHSCVSCRHFLEDYPESITAITMSPISGCSVQDLLKRTEDPQVVQLLAKDAKRCENCGNLNQNVYRALKIMKLPDVLTIVLERNQFGMKNMNSVSISESVSLNDCRFFLQCLICHSGTQATNGHYVQYFKTGFGWQKVDMQEKYLQCTFDEVRSDEKRGNQAFLLHYSKYDIIPMRKAIVKGTVAIESSDSSDNGESSESELSGFDE
eukprot:TRINITY_DN82922_c0_g1_i5.p1 TRINITY_DN82922_c0_g1~~TRINITY_DN82922_c0_g1_i5.p1  ORF type:complete len:401 (-),score=58.45 TRINITY_DN82922_c0_g1_i5:231-1433(-)